MKILAYVPHYIGYNHNAGAEVTLHEMLYALRLRGHHVTVLLSEKVAGLEPFVIDGIKVQPHASKHDPNYLIPEHDLVISHLSTAERAAYICNDKKKPHVQLVHNTHWTSHQAMEAGCDLAVFNTNWVKESYAPVESVVLHPAVRPEAYVVPRSGKEVLLVNLWRNKGAELFYSLAKRNPKINFLGVRGGYQEQHIRILPNVAILDNLSDIREAYKRTKVVLMPSAYESYGRVALEAAASGIPAIVSDTLGLKEALGDAAMYVDSPQVAVPGDTPAAWTDVQIEAWEKALHKILTPAGYGKASKSALTRSQEVWSQTSNELTEFCDRVERLVYGPN